MSIKRLWGFTTAVLAAAASVASSPALCINPADEGPRVRIRLPLTWSPVRTLRLRLRGLGTRDNRRVHGSDAQLAWPEPMRRSPASTQRRRRAIIYWLKRRALWRKSPAAARPPQILTFYLLVDPITKRPHDRSSPAASTQAYSEGRSELKIIIGIEFCVVGIIIWLTALIGATVIANPTVVSLGVIIGGGITASGTILMCLPDSPIRFSYFD